MEWTCNKQRRHRGGAVSKRAYGRDTFASRRESLMRDIPDLLSLGEDHQCDRNMVSNALRVTSSSQACDPVPLDFDPVPPDFDPVPPDFVECGNLLSNEGAFRDDTELPCSGGSRLSSNPDSGAFDQSKA